MRLLILLILSMVIKGRYESIKIICVTVIIDVDSDSK